MSPPSKIIANHALPFPQKPPMLPNRTTSKSLRPR